VETGAVAVFLKLPEKQLVLADGVGVKRKHVSAIAGQSHMAQDSILETTDFKGNI